MQAVGVMRKLFVFVVGFLCAGEGWGTKQEGWKIDRIPCQTALHFKKGVPLTRAQIRAIAEYANMGLGATPTDPRELRNLKNLEGHTTVPSVHIPWADPHVVFEPHKILFQPLHGPVLTFNAAEGGDDSLCLQRTISTMWEKASKRYVEPFFEDGLDSSHSIILEIVDDEDQTGRILFGRQYSTEYGHYITKTLYALDMNADVSHLTPLPWPLPPVMPPKELPSLSPGDSFSYGLYALLHQRVRHVPPSSSSHGGGSSSKEDSASGNTGRKKEREAAKEKAKKKKAEKAEEKRFFEKSSPWEGSAHDVCTTAPTPTLKASPARPSNRPEGPFFCLKVNRLPLDKRFKDGMGTKELIVWLCAQGFPLEIEGTLDAHQIPHSRKVDCLTLPLDDPRLDSISFYPFLGLYDFVAYCDNLGEMEKQVLNLPYYVVDLFYPTSLGEYFNGLWQSFYHPAVMPKGLSLMDHVASFMFGLSRPQVDPGSSKEALLLNPTFQKEVEVNFETLINNQVKVKILCEQQGFKNLIPCQNKDLTLWKHMFLFQKLVLSLNKVVHSHPPETKFVMDLKTFVSIMANLLDATMFYRQELKRHCLLEGPAAIEACLREVFNNSNALIFLNVILGGDIIDPTAPLPSQQGQLFTTMQQMNLSHLSLLLHFSEALCVAEAKGMLNFLTPAVLIERLEEEMPEEESQHEEKTKSKKAKTKKKVKERLKEGLAEMSRDFNCRTSEFYVSYGTDLIREVLQRSLERAKQAGAGAASSGATAAASSSAPPPPADSTSPKDPEKK
ncbi:hypothetical protein AGMMS49949_00710 [Alphaproteobacteria bacterium]|nr:hypothetical protein AGMMS49949_00710 [Alphaproteobacteria bacterium]GHS96202.1 hypothetical protein AGMMS50296_2130 [Alphaproteobacteria bacterium]